MTPTFCMRIEVVVPKPLNTCVAWGMSWRSVDCMKSAGFIWNLSGGRLLRKLMPPAPLAPPASRGSRPPFAWRMSLSLIDGLLLAGEVEDLEEREAVGCFCFFNHPFPGF